MATQTKEQRSTEEESHRPKVEEQRSTDEENRNGNVYRPRNPISTKVSTFQWKFKISYGNKNQKADSLTNYISISLLASYHTPSSTPPSSPLSLSPSLSLSLSFFLSFSLALSLSLPLCQYECVSSTSITPSHFFLLIESDR